MAVNLAARLAGSSVCPEADWRVCYSVALWETPMVEHSAGWWGVQMAGQLVCYLVEWKAGTRAGWKVYTKVGASEW